MGRIKDYFTEQGLTAADLPKALIFHEVISVAFAAFTWASCYGIQPSVTLVRPLRALPGASRAAGAFDKALAFSDKKVAGMTWLKKIPVVRNAAPRRLTVSLAESLMFRGAIKPITFGGKLYLSYKFVMWGKERKERKEAAAAERAEGTVRGRGVRKTGPACLSLSLPAPQGLSIHAA